MVDHLLAVPPFATLLEPPVLVLDGVVPLPAVPPVPSVDVCRCVRAIARPARAGKSLFVQLPTRSVQEPQVPENAPQVTAAPKRAQAMTVPARAAASSPSVDWRGAVTRQDWNQAWNSLGDEGVAREAAHTDDVADLLALADVARLSGHPQQAVAPLRQIVGSHAEDPRSAMAAFTLGRVLLDALRQPMQASFAFERALTLKLPAPLAEDALARLVESHAKAGAANQARAAAKS